MGPQYKAAVRRWLQRSRSYSPLPERAGNCFKQGLVTERFQQVRDCSTRQEAWPKGRVTLCGDEDDRNTCLLTYQLLLKLWPAHAGQSDVEDQTVCLLHGVGGQE